MSDFGVTPSGSKFSLEPPFCPDIQPSCREKSIREDETQKAISTPAGAGNRAECNSAIRQFEKESILGSRKSLQWMRQAEKMSTLKK